MALAASMERCACACDHGTFANPLAACQQWVGFRPSKSRLTVDGSSQTEASATSVLHFQRACHLKCLGIYRLHKMPSWCFMCVSTTIWWPQQHLDHNMHAGDDLETHEWQKQWKSVSRCSKQGQLATSILLGPHSSSLHQWPELRSPWSILSTTLTQGAVLAKPLNSNCNTVITFNNIYQMTIYLHYLHYAVYNVVTYLHVQVSEVLMRSKSLSPSWTL